MAVATHKPRIHRRSPGTEVPKPRNRSLTARRRTFVYWATTAVVVSECAVGGAMDLLRMPPFYHELVQLGYPSYLATILGTAKVLAAVVLLAPELPRLKEWAYAGVVINMVGAAASNAAAHRPVGSLITPTVFVGLALLSRMLLPARAVRQ
jgi:hypothetical protein